MASEEEYNYIYDEYVYIQVYVYPCTCMYVPFENMLNNISLYIIYIIISVYNRHYLHGIPSTINFSIRESGTL